MQLREPQRRAACANALLELWREILWVSVERLDAVHGHRTVNVDIESVQKPASMQAREAMHEQLRATERKAGDDDFGLACRGICHDFCKFCFRISARIATTLAVGAFNNDDIRACGLVRRRKQRRVGWTKVA